MKYKILVINPGSTSTKIAVFENEKELLTETIRHNHGDLEKFSSVIDQYQFRAEIIEKVISRGGLRTQELSAVVGRGGLLRPMAGGVWTVNKKMMDDLKHGARGEHASNLGAIIAYDIAKKENIPAFIVDPVVVDEMQDVAKLSGHPDFSRLSKFHALNQKACARRAAEEINKEYNNCNFIVAHLGGGISVGAHRNGSVIDVKNALNGDGPFSPERSGALPAGQIVEACFSGKYTKKDIMVKLKGRGDLKAYLDTADGTEVEKLIENGDEKALLVFRAMGYQIAKEVGALGTPLKGKIDGIILTGGLAFSNLLVDYIKDHISFLGKVFIYPGEGEMDALRDGALRVLRGFENPKEY